MFYLILHHEKGILKFVQNLILITTSVHENFNFNVNV